MIDLPWPVVGLLIWAAVLALDLAYTLVTSRRRRGKRKPTPSELRRYAYESGWSEDFARYDDRQLADWLNRGGWDIAAGMNQGGFLRQFDQTPGNDLPGVRGGVLGGSNQGGIWWQGTPGGGGGRPAPNTGVMLPGGSAVQPTGTPSRRRRGADK